MIYCREDVPSVTSIAPVDGPPACLRCARTFRRDWDVKRHRPTHSSWMSMLARCRSTNPKSTGWKYYSSRGITVCGRWQIYDHFLDEAVRISDELAEALHPLPGDDLDLSLDCCRVVEFIRPIPEPLDELEERLVDLSVGWSTKPR